MKHIIYHIFLLVSSIYFTGCNKDGGIDDLGFTLDDTNIKMSDIAGSWEGNMAIFSRTTAGPVLEIDVVEQGGWFVMEIFTNGEFTVDYANPEPGKFPYFAEGIMRFDEDLLVLIFEDDLENWEYFSIAHNEPNLIIEGGPVEEAIDFDKDDIDEAAFVYLDMDRIH